MINKDEKERKEGSLKYRGGIIRRVKGSERIDMMVGGTEGFYKKA